MDACRTEPSLALLLLTCMVVYSYASDQQRQNLTAAIISQYNPFGQVNARRNESFASIFYGHKRQGNLINLISYYEGCGVEKGCVPKLCLKQHSCDYLINWYFVPETDYIRFQVVGRKIVDKQGAPCSTYKEKSNAYIAIAFTETETMNDAIVVECSMPINVENPERVAIMGWNSDKTYKRWDYVCKEESTTGKIINCQVNLDMNSHMVCEFGMKHRVVISAIIFNFAVTNYYMHVVSGCDVSEIDKGITNAARKFTTKNPVVLELYDDWIPSM